MIHARDDYNRIQDPDGKIPTGEPVFLLRAQDKYAAEAVKYYAELISRDADASDKALDISAIAFDWSETMEAWPHHKSPDI